MLFTCLKSWLSDNYCVIMHTSLSILICLEGRSDTSVLFGTSPPLKNVSNNFSRIVTVQWVTAWDLLKMWLVSDLLEPCWRCRLSQMASPQANVSLCYTSIWWHPYSQSVVQYWIQTASRSKPIYNPLSSNSSGRSLWMRSLCWDLWVWVNVITFWSLLCLDVKWVSYCLDCSPYAHEPIEDWSVSMSFDNCRNVSYCLLISCHPWRLKILLIVPPFLLQTALMILECYTYSVLPTINVTLESLWL